MKISPISYYIGDIVTEILVSQPQFALSIVEQQEVKESLFSLKICILTKYFLSLLKVQSVALPLFCPFAYD